MSKEENKNEEFDKFLNKKEEGNGYDSVENTSTEKAGPDSNPELASFEETINEKGLGSVDISNYGRKKADSTDTVLGYVPLSMETLFSKGRFYPQDASIHVRSAKVAEIRHFSTMNEQNILDIEEKLNNIVKSCIRFESKSKKLSYKDLMEEDRIAVLLAIRDLTFPEPENKIIVQAENSYGQTKDVEIATNNFVANEIPEEIEKYYDVVSRCFRIQTRSSGEILMRPPSIGVMEEVTKYIRTQQESKKRWDQAFIQILPYIQLDWRGFSSKEIFNQEIDFQGWNEKKYMVVYRLAEKMRIGAQPEMQVDVDGEDVSVPLDFPGGVKSLFIISDLAGELL